eukprot:CCRYP_015198-RA/>CCRYP_015198-RA protein AED:0.09 eAED:0.09 QI:0/0.5/0.33/1/0.5/0.33/3/832/790
MPIYLCLPGHSSKEPWRHGMRIYDRPHDIDHPHETSANTNSNTTSALPSLTTRIRRLRRPPHPNMTEATLRSFSDSSNEGGLGSSDRASPPPPPPPPPNEAHSSSSSPPQEQAYAVRRARHAEVLLADDTVISHGRRWVRLRWPGELGGFGGFVAMDLVRGGGENGEENDVGVGEKEKEVVGDESGVGDESERGNDEEQRGPEGGGEGGDVTAVNTVKFPSSKAMKLLTLYDDGLGERSGEGGEFLEGEGGEVSVSILYLVETCRVVCYNSLALFLLFIPPSPNISLTIFFLHLKHCFSPQSSSANVQPVFCRICREGLHDVNYDLETATDTNPTTKTNSVLSEAKSDLEPTTPQQSANDATATPSASPPHSSTLHIPPLVLHHPTADNPLLAPCSCTGSMAFVHYLCIEQWRCRSRHPAAKNGLNCETCGSEYTLPPPPSRPTSRHGVLGDVMAEEDWMDGMPPHVLAALRRPHIFWQIGAAAVRRRWLRPFVPVFVSPLVALYCRARRTLKKRGVSRRRWACSLCRRRARWKCVRCLRSYYCSRQCQNVSWHIVHKHVCYKPGRFWWSVVVYTVGVLVAVPGILKDLLLYDLMLTMLPINFMVMGIIAGGVATVIKLYQGSDLRGRSLELAVVFFTIWLTILSSGLVNGYFGDTSKCVGFVPPLGSLSVGPFGPLVTMLQQFLRMWQPWYKKWDYVFAKLGIVSNRILCSPGPSGSTDYSTIGCSTSIRNINPEFYLGDEGQHCRADMVLVLGFWMCALLFLGVGNLERYWRGRRVPAHRGRGRPHQD